MTSSRLDTARQLAEKHDFASLARLVNRSSGPHFCTSVGVYQLPRNAAVELEATVVLQFA